MVRDNFLKLLPYYGHLVNIMFTIGALSQYKMFIIFEGICSIEKLYNIFIPTDARQASVIAGRCAPHRRPGAVSVPYHSLYAQHSHNHFLYFYRAIRTGNLAGGAETKRPREKSFIRVISQIENAAKKSSTRVTSEVRKCPKTHFCRFWFLPNSVFCDLRKSYGVVTKNDPHQNVPPSYGHLA